MGSAFTRLWNRQIRFHSGKSGGEAGAFCHLYPDVCAVRQNICSVKELLEQIIEDTGYVEELKAEDTEEARPGSKILTSCFPRQLPMRRKRKIRLLSGFLEEVALVADIDSVDER